MYRPEPSYHSIKVLLWLLTICAGIVSCEKEDHMSGAPQVSTMMVPMRDTLPPVIAENTLLTNTHPWYIAGWVYVSNEATLTIEPGTVINITGEKDAGAGLVITRGAKIMASGLSNWPILFQLTDTTPSWSGIVLLGRAPLKRSYPLTQNVTSDSRSSGWAYGGELPDDSSGVLQHIRIAPERVLLLGVGSRTIIQDIALEAGSRYYNMEAIYPE